MELYFQTKDQKKFLEKIGYIVEQCDVKWSDDGGRREDSHYDVKMNIAYKGDKPNTNLGYEGDYNFKNKYEIERVFSKEFPAYLVNTVSAHTNKF